MKDADCVRFLQWALPRLHMRWPGFRKVRGQVCKRIAKRLTQLQIHDITRYQAYLSRQPQEWVLLDKLSRVTISRFYRDKQVFAYLTRQILPELAARVQSTEDKTIRVWSIGCSSGEEPYTLAIIWQQLLAPHFPAVRLSVFATEADPHLLDRCQQACYPASSVKNLPVTLRTRAFICSADQYCLKPEYKSTVEFARQDIRKTLPDVHFHLILCRNLVFTYFDEEWQQTILSELYARLYPEGWFVLGVHEQLPANSNIGFDTVSARLGLYQKHRAVVSDPA